MSKNPFISALLAFIYIIVVASVMYYGPKLASASDDTVIIPIAMLSLFVLSAAVMGYLFLYQPLQLYFDGEKNQAVKLFLSTVAIFAGITGIILIILFSGVLF